MKKQLLFFVVFVVAQRVLAQDSTGIEEEVWPEANLFYKINKKIRIYALYSTTKLKNSSYTDGGYGINVDYFAFPGLRRKFTHEPLNDSTRGYYVWFRMGYFYSTTPADAEDPTTENTIVTEASFRYHLPYDILLTNRNRFDWRIINGDFMPRYRFRLSLEKDMHTAYLQFTPYIHGEYYMNFNPDGSNRLRVSVGMELRVASHIDFEPYFLRQFDNGKNVDALNAVGLKLKFYLDHQQIKQRFSKKNKKT